MMVLFAMPGSSGPGIVASEDTHPPPATTTTTTTTRMGRKSILVWEMYLFAHLPKRECIDDPFLLGVGC